MLPAEHSGNVEFRKWYKVRWLTSPHPGDAKWEGIAGRIDLIMDEDLGNYREHVEIIDCARAKKCASGLPLGFGKLSEERIDEWMRMNSV